MERDIADLREIAEASAVDTQHYLFKALAVKHPEFGADRASMQTWTDAEIRQCLRLLDSFPG